MVTRASSAGIEAPAGLNSVTNGTAQTHTQHRLSIGWRGWQQQLRQLLCLNLFELVVDDIRGLWQEPRWGRTCTRCQPLILPTQLHHTHFDPKAGH